MYIIDAHCDTLSTGRDLFRNGGHFDIERAAARGPGLQVMAAFGQDKPAQLDRLSAVAGYLGVRPEGFGLLPAVEGGDDITRPEDVDQYIGRGVRFFGLTWNHDNALAGGCKGAGGGLTELGRIVVGRLEDAGVLVDLSHSSEKTFWDVLEISRRPPVVTHACCAALRPHPRNLTDGQIRALAEKGGVMGVAFYPPFLTGGANADISDVARHIERAVMAGGAECAGLGSDFDGCDALPGGLRGTQDVPRLVEGLRLPGRTRELVAGGNFMRVILRRH